MKVLNVFGIILAWILSIALVALLIAAPVTFSALSLLDAENITQAVTDSFGPPSAAVPDKGYGMVSLSDKKGSPVEVPPVDKILGDLDLGVLENILGGEIDAEAVNKIIVSDAAKDIVEAYVEDVIDTLSGQDGPPRLNEEKLIEVVEDNIDEIAKIVQEVAPEFSESSITEVKNEIKKAIRENAGKILESIVTPQQIRDAIFDSGAGTELVADLLAQRNTFQASVFGAIVLLSLLIFLLRLPGFRGLRWVSSDLFTATGLNAVICVILFVSSSAIIGLADGIKLLDAINVNAIIRSILTTFTRGVILRTVIMLVAAVVLMVLYVILKSVRHKKPAKQSAPVFAAPAAVSAPVYKAPVAVQPVAAEPVPAPPVVPAPAPVAPDSPAAEEPQPTAPVPYTAPPVIEAPDLMADSESDDILPENWEFEVDITPAEAPQPEQNTEPEVTEAPAEPEAEPEPEVIPEPEPKPEDDTLF